MWTCSFDFYLRGKKKCKKYTQRTIFNSDFITISGFLQECTDEKLSENDTNFLRYLFKCDHAKIQTLDDAFFRSFNRRRQAAADAERSGGH